MARVSRGHDLAGANRLSCLADQHAVHDEIAIERNVFCRELVFRGDVGIQDMLAAGKTDSFSRAQVPQSDQNIVGGIKLQYGVLHDNLRDAKLLSHLPCERNLHESGYNKRARRFQDYKSDGPQLRASLDLRSIAV